VLAGWVHNQFIVVMRSFTKKSIAANWAAEFP